MIQRRRNRCARADIENVGPWLEGVRRLRTIAFALGALAAAPLVVASAAAWATPQQPVTYSVPPPTEGSHLSQGWGLFATISGRSTDLDSLHLQWSDDPRVQRHDVEAGYGWREGSATALIGYEQHDFGPKYDAVSVPGPREPDSHRVGGSGVLGLSVVLHAP